MSSIQASFAQNKSRTFVTLATGKAITFDVLDALLSVQGADSVGSDYTLYDATTFNTVSALAGSTALVVGETLIDLGKELTVGLDGVDGVLLKFRLVKRTTGGPVDDPIDGDAVYVVVENNVSKATGVSANSLVSVARV